MTGRLIRIATKQQGGLKDSLVSKRITKKMGMAGVRRYTLSILCTYRYRPGWMAPKRSMHLSTKTYAKKFSEKMSKGAGASMKCKVYLNFGLVFNDFTISLAMKLANS